MMCLLAVSGDDNSTVCRTLLRYRGMAREQMYEHGTAPASPVLLGLGSGDELDALAVGFEFGSAVGPGVTDDQWKSILALIEDASRSV